jgi:hypothetical protein
MEEEEVKEKFWVEPSFKKWLVANPNIKNMILHGV